MGHSHGPDGAHSHGSGSGGTGAVVLVILGVVLVAAAARPIAAAAAELLRLVLITAAVILGLTVAGVVALVAWRLRQGRANAPRVVARVTPSLPRPARALPAPRRSTAALPAAGQAPELHLHLHGLTAEEAAAIVRQAHLYGTGNEHPAIEED